MHDVVDVLAVSHKEILIISEAKLEAPKDLL